MYISAFPTLSLRQMMSLKKGCLNPQVFLKGRSFFYFRGANAVYQGVKFLHIGINDNVLMPAFHCGVEVEAVLKAKTNVQFYKINENLEIDLKDLEQRINADTKAVFVIHYFGFPQKIDEIKKLCQKHRLLLIEDCAHALYSRYQNEYLGNFGDVSIFSLQKTLPVCDGGALVVHQAKGIWKEQVSFPNWLTTLRGATLLRLEHIKMFYPMVSRLFEIVLMPVKAIFRMLKRLGKRSFSVNVPSSGNFDLSQSSKSISSFSKKIADSIDDKKLVAKRRENYLYLSEQLKEQNAIKMLFSQLEEGVCPLFLPVVINNRFNVKEKLARNGIHTFIFGEILHRTLEKGFDPTAEKFALHILCLPIHQDLNKQHLDHVARHIKEAVK
jgi:perosamine synthetase